MTMTTTTMTTPFSFRVKSKYTKVKSKKSTPYGISFSQNFPNQMHNGHKSDPGDIPKKNRKNPKAMK
jgi:hypothetical protein